MSKLTQQNIYDILFNRIKSEDYNSLKDLPKPLLFKDIVKAGKRIAKAINNNENITIVGDYDVDGVTSTVILSELFEIVGLEVEIIIPNRFTDGYGISPKIIDRIEKADLIITVDNGISAVKAGELCKSRGIDLIITDHHKVGEKLPEAYAIVNPHQEDCKYPFKEICGAQVAWYLVAQIKSEMNLKIDMRNSLDILAIGIIADVMPLIELNRIFVQVGLQQMGISKKPAFLVMKEILNINKFSSETIAFQIAPRLNSAGRMDTAMLAFNFFKSKTIEEALNYFEQLTDLNNERKEVEKNITEASKKLVDKDDNIIVVYGDDLHEGVIGTVASRLVEEFKKPAIVFSIKDGIAKASARSLGEVNLYNLIATQKDILLGFGGHKLAAGLGLKVENLELFKKNINIEAGKIDKKSFIEESDVFGEISMNEVNLDLISLLDKFEPYGEKNKRPIFKSKLEVKTFKKVGKDEEHLQVTLLDKITNTTHKAIKFRFKEEIKIKQNLEITFSVSKNEFRNNVSVQLMLEDIN